MKNQFWDDLGSQPSTENSGMIMSNFLGHFFHVFMDKKQIYNFFLKISKHPRSDAG
jgi:hypothetical protein